MWAEPYRTGTGVVRSNMGARDWASVVLHISPGKDEGKSVGNSTARGVIEIEWRVSRVNAHYTNKISLNKITVNTKCEWCLLNTICYEQNISLDLVKVLKHLYYWNIHNLTKNNAILFWHTLYIIQVSFMILNILFYFFK